MNLNKRVFQYLFFLLLAISFTNTFTQQNENADVEAKKLFNKYADKFAWELQKVFLKPYIKYNLDEFESQNPTIEDLQTILDTIYENNAEINDKIIERKKEYLITWESAKAIYSGFLTAIFEIPKVKSSGFATDSLTVAAYKELKTDTKNEFIKEFNEEFEKIDHIEREGTTGGESGDDTPFLLFLSIIFSLVSFIIAIFLWFKVRYLPDFNEIWQHIDDNTDRIKNLKKLSSTGSAWESVRGRSLPMKQTGSSEIEKLKNDVEILKHNLSRLEFEVSKRVIPSRKENSVNDFENLKNISIPEPRQPENIYYLTEPDPSGFFWDDKKSSTYSSNYAAFELRIDPFNSNAGEFQIVNDENKHKALINSSDILLEPACEIIGKRDGTKINPIKPGIVHLRGDKWQITTKCLINIT